MGENENESVPPGLCAVIAYNLKKGIKGGAIDSEAEYDSFETIDAIKKALETEGIKVDLIEADTGFPDKIRQSKADIVFNIAEGLSGRGREAHIPAILSFLGIPYTGSDETTLCLSLDKAITKRYLSAFGFATPRYQVVREPAFVLDPELKFPVIVKPNQEGSGKGISEIAIADCEEQLRNVVAKNLATYDQPMLIEEFIKGREFTVGILGNGDGASAFEPMEIKYLSSKREESIYSYNVKCNYKKYVEYVCPPADLPAGKTEEIKEIALGIHKTLECRDFSRIDFRMSEDGIVYFIEINPLPGLAPGYSDFPMLAGFCGTGYNELVLSVLKNALARYGRFPSGGPVCTTGRIKDGAEESENVGNS